MLIKSTLVANSEQRFKQAHFSPTELNRKLGDGPIQMTAEQKLLRQRQLLEQTEDAQAAQIGLERIINGNDLDSINYLAKGTLVSRSVCRIQLRDARSNLVGYASGFLIGPGLLITNHHVFGKPADATNSIADFDYELDVAGMEHEPVRFAFEPDKFFYTNDRLDYSQRTNQTSLRPRQQTAEICRRFRVVYDGHERRLVWGAGLQSVLAGHRPPPQRHREEGLQGPHPH